MTDFQGTEVLAAFDAYPEQVRKSLLAIRALIFLVATKTAEVGSVTETLKWGQPSYAGIKAGIGSAVRLGHFGDSHIAVFFHCQTTLIESFRTLFPELTYSKNRAIVLDPEDPLYLGRNSRISEAYQTVLKLRGGSKL